MAKFAHVLTGIPLGSKVRVYATGRFLQFDEDSTTGAIAFTGSRSAYPIRVSIRPVIGGESKGMKVRVPMAGSNFTKAFTESGGIFDLSITDVKQYNPGGIELFLPDNKAVGPCINAVQCHSEETAVTRIVNKYACRKCNAELPGTGVYCDTCIGEPETCEHLAIGATTPKQCGNPLVPGIRCCKEHAKLLGIKLSRTGKKPKAASGRPTKRRKVKRTKREKPVGKKIAVVMEEQLALPM